MTIAAAIVAGVILLVDLWLMDGRRSGVREGKWAGRLLATIKVFYWILSLALVAVFVFVVFDQR